jgi:hypothetical protein
VLEDWIEREELTAEDRELFEEYPLLEERELPELALLEDRELPKEDSCELAIEERPLEKTDELWDLLDDVEPPDERDDDRDDQPDVAILLDNEGCSEEAMED